MNTATKFSRQDELIHARAQNFVLVVVLIVVLVLESKAL